MPTNIYINNKYTKIYYQIINRAITRLRPEGKIQKHHIIPKCKSFGGNNFKENLVCLTNKEHWICHLLLRKMCKNWKQKRSMNYAMHRMMISKYGFITSGKMYDIYHQQFIKSITGKNSPWYKRKHTKSECKNISKSTQGRIPWNKGKKMPIRTKKWNKNISKAKTGKKQPTHTQKTKDKQSESNSKITWEITFPDGKKEIIKSLTRFCIKYGLLRTCMGLVASGRRSHHKGFKCIKITS